MGGYNQMNGTRPQTIAAALSDSPVGQLAYNELFENFGNGTSLVSQDQVLTQVSLDWLTNTSATAVRYHFAEGHSGAEPKISHGRTGVAVFADDFPDPPAAGRARQHEHRRLVGVRPRRALRRAGGPRAVGRRPPRLLRASAAEGARGTGGSAWRAG